MALTTVPAGKIVYDLLDESGTPGKMALHFPSTTLVADAITSGDALATAVGFITGCVVRGYTLSYSRRETSVVAPADGARVENKGTFVFALANGLTSRVEVPGILESVLLPSGSIDVENSAVADFLDAIITAPAIFRGLDGSDIVAVKSAYQKFRSSTKAQLPSDRVKFG